MRAFYRDILWGSEVAGDLITVSAVGRPTAAADLRDYWIRMDSAAASSAVAGKVYRTRQEARDGTGHIGSFNIALGAAGTVAVTNAPAEKPSTAGMTVTYDASAGVVEEVAVIYGYTAAPDVAVCEDFITLLAEYTGEGRALVDYASSLQVGDPGQQHLAVVAFCVTDSVSPVVGLDKRSLVGREYVIRVQCMRSGLDAGNDAGANERLARLLRDDTAAVESILLDERRDWHPEVAAVTWRGVEMPSPVDAPYDAYAGAAVLLGVQFVTIRSDYVEA